MHLSTLQNKVPQLTTILFDEDHEDQKNKINYIDNYCQSASD